MQIHLGDLTLDIFHFCGRLRGLSPRSNIASHTPHRTNARAWRGIVGPKTPAILCPVRVFLNGSGFQ